MRQDPTKRTVPEINGLIWRPNRRKKSHFVVSVSAAVGSLGTLELSGLKMASTLREKKNNGRVKEEGKSDMAETSDKLGKALLYFIAQLWKATGGKTFLCCPSVVQELIGATWGGRGHTWGLFDHFQQLFKWKLGRIFNFFFFVCILSLQFFYS